MYEVISAPDHYRGRYGTELSSLDAAVDLATWCAKHYGEVYVVREFPGGQVLREVDKFGCVYLEVGLSTV